MAIKKEWKETKINLSHAIIGGAIALVLGVIIGIGWNSFSPYLGVNGGLNAPDWSSLNEIYSILVSKYDGELDAGLLIDGAKHGMVDAVGDPYTEYFNSSEASAFSDDLHGKVGSGIGVEIGLRENYVRVLRTLPDNPARKAGILAGDILYKIEDEIVYGKSSDYIANKLRGEEGSSVSITVYRNGKYLDFAMTREPINNVSAYIDYDGTTAIITLTRFDNDTGTKVQSLIKDFSEKKIDKVILDLRNNGGGYVSAAKDLLSLWLDGDKIFSQRSVKTGEQIGYAYTGRASLKNMKTIVLINGSTASASEIVAGALQDHGKATILGEASYGKGVVQTLAKLSLGSELKVTVAHWYTPNGTSISGSGIKPDVEVIRTWDDINAMRDPQLDKAKSL